MSYRVRPNVLRMHPYSPGKPIEEVQRELGLTDVVKLASNENPLGPSPLAVKAVVEAAQGMHVYPDASGRAVREALSAHVGVPSGQIVLGNGSDEVLNVLGQVFLDGPGHRAVMGWPSFLRYPATAELADSQCVRVPLDAEWRHDIGAMIEAVDEQTRLVFVANPNNPTGTLVPGREIERLLTALPSGALMVLDEAYYEFACDVEGYPDSVAWVREGRPVVVVRTFSKSYGLAGIRVGYAFAPLEVVDAYNRVREPFDVNSLAQAAAIAALKDEDHLRRTLEVNREGMRRIVARMEELGRACVESHANFVCIEVGDGKAVAEALLHQGVIVRSGHVFDMPRHIRVTIGNGEQVERFLTAFEQVSRG
jgi:histidinol-phosphate aminotransferase